MADTKIVISVEDTYDLLEKNQYQVQVNRQSEKERKETESRIKKIKDKISKINSGKNESKNGTNYRYKATDESASILYPEPISLGGAWIKITPTRVYVTSANGKSSASTTRLQEQDLNVPWSDTSFKEPMDSDAEARVDAYDGLFQSLGLSEYVRHNGGRIKRFRPQFAPGSSTGNGSFTTARAGFARSTYRINGLGGSGLEYMALPTGGDGALILTYDYQIKFASWLFYVYAGWFDCPAVGGANNAYQTIYTMYESGEIVVGGNPDWGVGTLLFEGGLGRSTGIGSHAGLGLSNQQVDGYRPAANALGMDVYSYLILQGIYYREPFVVTSSQLVFDHGENRRQVTLGKRREEFLAGDYSPFNFDISNLDASSGWPWLAKELCSWPTGWKGHSDFMTKHEEGFELKVETKVSLFRVTNTSSKLLTLSASQEATLLDFAKKRWGRPAEASDLRDVTYTPRGREMFDFTYGRGIGDFQAAFNGRPDPCYPFDQYQGNWATAAPLYTMKVLDNILFDDYPSNYLDRAKEGYDSISDITLDTRPLAWPAGGSNPSPEVQHLFRLDPRRNGFFTPAQYFYHRNIFHGYGTTKEERKLYRAPLFDFRADASRGAYALTSTQAGTEAALFIEFMKARDTNGGPQYDDEGRLENGFILFKRSIGMDPDDEKYLNSTRRDIINKIGFNSTSTIPSPNDSGYMIFILFTDWGEKSFCLKELKYFGLDNLINQT